MNNLDKKTQEFILAVKETKEFKAYKKALDVYKADKESQQLLKDLNLAQQNLAILEHGNFEGQKEQKEKVEDLLNKVRKNKVINNWIDTQKNLQPLINDLVSGIGTSLEFPFGFVKQKGGCCG